MGMNPDIFTKAKITNYGTAKNGSGSLQIFANLTVDMNSMNKTPLEGNDANLKNFIWFGHLSTEGARETTIKALLVMGFTGDDISEIQKGPEGKALDMERVIDVCVGDEADTREDHKGEFRTKVKWINPPGGGAGKVESLDATETKKLLKDLNLKAVLTSVKKENPNLVEVAKGAAKEVF